MSRASAIGRELRAAISKTMAEAMTRATHNLADATPKDTTHASRNWIPSVRVPFQGVDGTQQAPSDAEQQAGLERLKSYDVGKDGPIFIRNNVDYVEFLDGRGEAEGFVAGALSAAADDAPVERRESVRKLLQGMAHDAYLKGV